MKALLVVLSLWCAGFPAGCLARTPMSVIGEPESFKDDAEARKSVLAYRVCVRPFKWAPVATKLYIRLTPPDARGARELRGRLVVKGIRDGTEDKIRVSEIQLSPSEVESILAIIDETEIFNLRADPPNSTPEQALSRPSGGLDGSSWTFERIQPKGTIPSRSWPEYSITSRGTSDHGPAHEAFFAFSKYGLRALNGAQATSKKSESSSASR